MRIKNTCLLLLLLSIFSPQLVNANETDWTAIGLRAGLSTTDSEEDFEQYEVYATYGLPWSWELTSGWSLSTRINLSAGALRGGGDTGFIGSAGPINELWSGQVKNSIGHRARQLAADRKQPEDCGFRIS